MNCPSCNKVFNCNADSSCWCNNLPVLNEIKSGIGCYCPDCLLKKTAQEINALKIIEPETKLKISALGLPANLIEGIDFDINKQGLYIFTSWYLLRRGHCCDNGCLNCPY